MNDDNKLIITPDGLKELENELNDRLTNVRKKIADEIAKAREQGDLSENAAYSTALESKQFNEARISELEELIKNAVVKKVNKSDRFAGLGETVKIKRVEDNVEFTYTLVGESSADPSNGKISIKSPLGMAIEGKKVGDKFMVELPTGNFEYVVVEIK